MRRVVAVLLLLLVVAAAAGAAYLWLLRDETISVRVRGIDEHVPKGETLAEAAARFELAPAAGDLLDIEGEILRVAAFPGKIVLNGRPAVRATELEAGDRIDAVAGRDRREPIQRLVIRVRGGRPPNPQFTLVWTPGKQVIERGRVSHKVVPLIFRPTGRRGAQRAVALTFDDGPSRYTARVLAVLHRLHAAATFFVVGRLAERYPGLVRREVAARMTVGNHSYSHPYRPPFDLRRRGRILAEIRRGAQAIDAAGPSPTLFRPPGGTFSAYVLEAAAAYRERVVLWSVDPNDWRPRTTAAQIARRVLAAVRPGSIVLLHDGGGNRLATVRALRAIVKGIRRKGLRLVLIEPEARGSR